MHHLSNIDFVKASVFDSDSLNPDPDSAYQVYPDSDTNPDPLLDAGHTSRVLMTEKKIQLDKIFIFFDKKIKVTVRYLSIRLLKRRPSYRRSL